MTEETGNLSSCGAGILRQQNETQIANPTPEAEAVARLTRVRSWGTRKGRPWNPDGPEAAALIERQAAEIERLRSTLPQAGEPLSSTPVADNRATDPAVKAGEPSPAQEPFAYAICWRNHDTLHKTLEDAEQRRGRFKRDILSLYTHPAPAQPDAGDLREAVEFYATGVEDRGRRARKALAALTGTQQAKGEG